VVGSSALSSLFLTGLPHHQKDWKQKCSLGQTQ
jgi:hypothetical protein